MAKRTIPDEVRQLCYRRDNFSCQAPDCQANLANVARLNLHHVIQEQFGGQETPDNLITLCDIHHKGQHIEFSAYYPDSAGVMKRMWGFLQRRLRQIKTAVGLDEGWELQPYLRFLAGDNARFRHGQLETIKEAMSGRDVLFVSPTGTGKSVCYQLPGLLAPKPSLVICPLKALMKDQVESIWDRKIPATYINSDLGSSEKSQRYGFIARQFYKFIFVAPERFTSNDPEQHHLYRDYSHLVVDEAHVVDKWGMNFRPAYRQLGQLRQKLKNPPIIALTATASRQGQELILESLGIPKAKVIVAGFYRDNIEILNRKLGSDNDKYQYIENLIRKNPKDKILIFTLTVKKGQELAEALGQRGIKVEQFHSKLDSQIKMDLQNRFAGRAEPKLQVLISTSAFGMGVNIPDIRHVVHFLPPINLTDYVQQIGRAGRDGKQSYAHLLYQPRDESLMKFMALDTTNWKQLATDNNHTPEQVGQIKQRLKDELKIMHDLTRQPIGHEWDYILNYFGEKQPSTWQTHGPKAIFGVFVLGLAVIGLFLLSLVILYWYIFAVMVTIAMLIKIIKSKSPK